MTLLEVSFSVLHEVLILEPLEVSVLTLLEVPVSILLEVSVLTPLSHHETVLLCLKPPHDPLLSIIL